MTEPEPFDGQERINPDTMLRQVYCGDCKEWVAPAAWDRHRALGETPAPQRDISETPAPQRGVQRF
jgi:hypothetical protein